MGISLKDILLSEAVCNDSQENLNKTGIYVEDDPVWDYKVQNEELRLISEPVKGSETYECVTLGELKKGITLLEAEYPVVAEATDAKLAEASVYSFKGGKKKIVFYTKSAE